MQEAQQVQRHAPLNKWSVKGGVERGGGSGREATVATCKKGSASNKGGVGRRQIRVGSSSSRRSVTIEPLAEACGVKRRQQRVGRSRPPAASAARAASSRRARANAARAARHPATSAAGSKSARNAHSAAHVGSDGGCRVLGPGGGWAGLAGVQEQAETF